MVFSNRQVVRQIQTDCVPVALKAALVNNPPRGVEGQLYAEIGRSKPAPQGICVANSAGKVLVWALSFDNDDSIAAFVDYAAKRYDEFPDARTLVTTERFMRYPSHKLPDIPDTGLAIPIPTQHDRDDRCPARPAVERGTLVGRVIGRALDEKGLPLADTLRQEHYMEARFEIPAAVQRQFVDAVRKANGEKFPLSDELIHTLVDLAYLGQLDVDPLGSVPGSRNDRRSWEFHGMQLTGPEAQPINGAQRIHVRITGRSDVAGGQRQRIFGGDGRMWEHAVKLEWQGYIEVADDQVERVTLLAEGHERLRWGNARFQMTQEVGARHLMAGHPIDLDCGVRYGLMAEPATEDEVVDDPLGPHGRANPPDQSPQTAQRIRGKIERLQARVKLRQQAGQDVSPIAELMRRFGPLMQKQEIDEAERILDRALELLGDDAPN